MKPKKSLWVVHIVVDVGNKAPITVVSAKTKALILAKLEAIEYGTTLGKEYMKAPAVMGPNATIQHIEGSL